VDYLIRLDQLLSVASSADIQKYFVSYSLIRNDRGVKKERHVIMKLYNLILLEPKFTMNGLSPINKVTDYWLGDRGSALEKERNICHFEESGDQRTVLYVKHS
jgi:hypothetical protein